ncbi:group II intron reverse transcriptase/maturase [Priestia megaterium]|uniref:group II intron reverse transcriptase/maturase n=1 Tax=Priestia megaterium TaxID=1404 RepID=UPI002E21E105|nr:group II intron reverse transcriptase/maturase [Priestia megaterium]MED4268159.1 group II intron reverse transcriptase/maturase [Priestia megaterium]MED4279631.1 group II intron reverse transcriptase/maturase [Priestia megaterium]MED4319195.1 group II intron reverse transcriptase/maturase [Priestia megaterium]
MNTSLRASAHVSHKDWYSIDWSIIHKYVMKLRQRIYRAEQQKQQRKVRKLQRLLLRSKANLLLSIRRVTQQNNGKRTPGVDGYTASRANERIKFYQQLVKYNVFRHRPKPAKRTFIPKKDGKLRPLGIPTMRDRVYQNVVKNALEPQWEVKFEPTSYGFRPKRSTHDAISNLFNKLNTNSKKKWVFEGDFLGCFDHLNHKWITKQTSMFPGNTLIKRWLEMGYIEHDMLQTTTEGTPQGGLVSPLLANIALCGMEEEIGIVYKKTYKPNGGYVIDPKCKIGRVLYADDFVIVTETKKQAESMYGKLTPYLQKRGINLSQEKTRVTYIEDGFDFLGFSLRQYKTGQGKKLFIKPSKDSIQKAKNKIKDTFTMMRGRPVKEIIRVLNPIIRGYGQYWKHVVSKQTFSYMDHYVFSKLVKHLKHLHQKKSWKWITKRYFRKPNHGGNDRWTLTCPLTNIQLLKMSWIKIERHIMVAYKNSPDDPILREYWEKRDRKVFNSENTFDRMKLARKQGYRCAVCKQTLQNGEKVTVQNLEVSTGKESKLVHVPCIK